jgi:hypothetical protein
MTTISCVLLRTVVVWFSPFHCATEAATKPEPVTVSAKPGQPAGALVSESDEIAGTGLLGKGLIVSVLADETPPPGAGLETVTLAMPATATSEAEMGAVSCVELTKVVGRLPPFHCTVETETKPVPITVNVNAASPALTLEGFSVEIAGAGLTGVLMVNKTALELPPPGEGLNTVTLAVPALAMSLPNTCAETRALDMKVVARSDPFHRTTELETKLEPSTTRVKPEPPAGVFAGAIALIEGVGFGGGGGGPSLPPPQEIKPRARTNRKRRASVLFVRSSVFTAGPPARYGCLPRSPYREPEAIQIARVERMAPQDTLTNASGCALQFRSQVTHERTRTPLTKIRKETTKA